MEDIEEAFDILNRSGKQVNIEDNEDNNDRFLDYSHASSKSSGVCDGLVGKECDTQYCSWTPMPSGPALPPVDGNNCNRLSNEDCKNNDACRWNNEKCEMKTTQMSS